MQYTNPKNGPLQPQLHIENDGRLITSSKRTKLHDELTKRSAEELNNFKLDRGNNRPINIGQLKATFYSDACIRIEAGKTKIFTDSWLYGLAMVKGWWLKNEPPDTWLDDLCDATTIYVSHTHSDHLYVHTLQKLFKRTPNACFIVPNFDSHSVFNQIINTEFKNVKAINFNEWHELSDECAVMIMKDATGREDSSFLVDYLGHRVLNLVDCTRPNNMDLPSSVELLFGAGGSTGYPICWSENYSDDFIEKWMKTDLQAMLDFVEDAVRKTQPKVVMPFAGYFIDAHPDDHDIMEKNTKNTWVDFDEVVVRCSPQTHCWYPTPGSSFDFADPKTIIPTLDGSEIGISNMQHDFAFWDKHLEEYVRELPLTDENLISYFNWSGFRGRILLHLVLTDNKFETVISEKIIDLESLQFVTKIKK